MRNTKKKDTPSSRRCSRSSCATSGDTPLHSESGAKNAAFYVFRYKRALKDDGDLGAFYTGREQGVDCNRLAGVDGQLRLSNSEMLLFHGFISATDNPLLPDKKGLALDAYYSYSTRDLDIDGNAFTIDRDFFSESGYLTRNGLSGFEGRVGPKFYPRASLFRKIKPSITGAVYPITRAA